MEVSPHPVLTAAIAETLDRGGALAAGTLRRDDGGPARLLASFAGRPRARRASGLGPVLPGRPAGRPAYLRVPA